jgi:hypothetical protein
MQEESVRADAVAMGLPDVPSYSAKVLECLKHGQMADKSDLTTLNDFKLLQLSWIYDLNFIASFRTAADRGYIEKLESMLPATRDIKEGVDSVRSHVEKKLREG